MANVKGPLFSVKATGSVAKTLTYKKGVRGYVCRKYAKPGGEPSASQEAIRLQTGNLMKNWKTLSTVDQASWFLLALERNIEPINAYLQLNYERLSSGGSSTNFNVPIILGNIALPFFENILETCHLSNWMVGFGGDGYVTFKDGTVFATKPENCEEITVIESQKLRGTLSLLGFSAIYYIAVFGQGLTTLPRVIDNHELCTADFSGNDVSDSLEIDEFLISLNSNGSLEGDLIDLRGDNMAPRTSLSDAAAYELSLKGFQLFLNE